MRLKKSTDPSEELRANTFVLYHVSIQIRPRGWMRSQHPINYEIKNYARRRGGYLDRDEAILGCFGPGSQVRGTVHNP